MYGPMESVASIMNAMAVFSQRGGGVVTSGLHAAARIDGRNLQQSHRLATRMYASV